MKLRYKILNSFLAVAALAVSALAITISYTPDCSSPPEVAAGTPTMKAIVSRCYGGPDVLEYVDVERPQPGSKDVIVEVRAAAVNPLDYHYMRGSPYLMRLSAGIGRPNDQRMGVDFSGVVVETGDEVSRFAVGDAVFGARSGAFAEYVVVPEQSVALKPANMTFEEAASVPQAAFTALHAVRDQGQVQPGQKVLINGASGGVGTFAVQIAKVFGAEVTAVCSARNLELVRSIGADHVIDYTQENFTQNGQRYDLIVDMVANHSLTDLRRVLEPNGSCVVAVVATNESVVPPFLASDIA